MVTNTLEYIIRAKDQASQAFESVSRSVEKHNSKMQALKVGATVASGVAVAGVVKFATDSVQAYSEAQQGQTELEGAYKRFPALANANIGALRQLNTETQRKTGYDDDALAGAQANLAQYKLSGKQIQQLTPLLADYAKKTGKDLPTAATDLGKAMLGQGRALKGVGINFKDTHSAAGNFSELMTGLKGQVGGVAEEMGGTAAGKVEILKQNFSDIQETVGGMLVPALSFLTDVGSKVMAWMQDNQGVVQALAIVIGILTLAIIGANIAMWAMAMNPVVLIILAIVVAVGILIAIVVLLVTHWKQVWAAVTAAMHAAMTWITARGAQFTAWWTSMWGKVGAWIRSVWTGFTSWVSTTWNNFMNGIRVGLAIIGAAWNLAWSRIGAFIANVWNNYIVAPIRNAWNWIQNAIRTGLGIINRVWNSVWNGLGGIVRGVFNGILGAIEGGVNGAIGLINGMIGAVNSVGGAVGIHIAMIPSVHLPRFATGTRNAPGGLALVGERGPEVVNLPQGSRVYPTGTGPMGGPMRLHPDDMRTIGQVIGQYVLAGIQRGSTQAILDATS